MSRLGQTSLEPLEPYDGKLSSTVLRGESPRKGADLLDHFLISGCLFPFKYFLIFRMAFFTKVPILRMKFSSFPENRSRIYPFRQITRRAESA